MQLVKYLIFSLFFNVSLFAQPNFIPNTNSEIKNTQNAPAILVIDELRNPQETMRTFMKAMDRYKHGESKAINEAIATLDLNQIDKGARFSIGRLTCERLINTIDRISKINYSNIPVNPENDNWIFRKQSLNINNQIIEVEIALHRTPEGFKFTPETVKTIEDYYHSVEKLKVVDGVIPLSNWKTSFKNSFPDWTGERLVFLKNGQWVGMIIVFIISLIIFYMVRLITNFSIKNNSESKNRYKSTLPLGLLAFGLSFRFGVNFLELDVDILEIILRLNYIFTAVCAVWSSLQMVDYLSFRFEKKALLTANKFDDVLVPMLKTAAKVLVVAFGGLLIAHSLTFDVASILAGLGIGGVAVAFAAKDTIANLFGSVTVLLDRPFNIGDYVVIDKVEGTVEQVGFRSTRIRTPINSLVTMPNSVLANLSIDNYGMRSYRRYRTMLGIEYGASEVQIQNFIERVRYQIGLNPNIEKKEVLAQVYLNDFGESSINILLSVYFIASTITVEFEERQKLILDIMKIANEVGVNFAYPTRTLLVKKEL